MSQHKTDVLRTVEGVSRYTT